MATVSYQFQQEYTLDPGGKRFPGLALQVTSVANSSIAVDVLAYLDSGAERSLFNGWVGASLGIDILSGPRIVYETVASSQLVATLHTVRLVHSDLGEFDLEVGFSSSEIRRDILGRDFFNLVQLGFREHHLTFFVTPTS